MAIKDDQKKNKKTSTAKSPSVIARKNSERTKNLAKAVQDVVESENQKALETERKNQARTGIEESGVGSKLVRGDLSPVNCKRDTLIVAYAPLIKYIAQRIAARLPANIELDDLMSAGVIGLMDAIDKYDASRDNKFKTYAEFRIRGAILDELRAQDWVPRSVREKAKQLEKAFAKIEQEKGRQATDDEVCDVLKISQDEYYSMLNQVRSVSLLSFEDFTSFSKADKRSLNSIVANRAGGSTPFNEVTLATLKKLVAEAIRELPEKQRLVLSLYYYEDLNLKEIGRVLDVTESRVSQLHTQAILRLKGKLRLHEDELEAILI